MKKNIILLLLGVVLTTSLFAQKRKSSTINWLSIAIKGGYGTTILMNQNIFNDINVAPNFMNGSYFVGGRFGWTFGDYVGLSFETDYSSFGQEYSITATSGAISKNIDFTSLDMLGLFRFTAETGFYLELGPKFSTIKSVKENPIPNPAFYPAGAMSIFNEKYMSAVLGLGFMPYMGDRITVSVGFRANYGWKNMVSDSYPLYFTVSDDGRYPQPATYTNSMTNLIQLHGVVELNYFFGFFGDATCGRGRLMLFQ